jgi:cell division protein ZapA (FtsZ GTPase activity inhibitor)
MPAQESLKVNIGGKCYVITTDEDSKVVQNAAKLVDSMIRQSAYGKSFEKEKIAIIVALKLAVELELKKGALEKYEESAGNLQKMLAEKVGSC